MKKVALTLSLLGILCAGSISFAAISAGEGSGSNIVATGDAGAS